MPIPNEAADGLRMAYEIVKEGAKGKGLVEAEAKAEKKHGRAPFFMTKRPPPPRKGVRGLQGIKTIFP